ncbi:hypothetical protein RNI54_003649 [Pseudomonas putida]|uniref:hypothetical protein n=1 Tax=Pseudomonas TaxID=286 RepID=UPI001E126993|nr:MULTISPECIES: hypothetical protein [Pseudomonas]ELF6206819.1 hypothetical protein [Pseudomonas putida]MPS97474.1 hypothetical protein [Pseudomonas sp.]GLO27587.1 hypothetical protein PPUJ21368_54180 [Pseudomonas putida]HDS0972401.1 hypothetical protein [Pseudomonas putida]
MPTENRSSNTEMVSVPRDTIEFAAGFTRHGYKSLTDQKLDQQHAQDQLRAILAAPAQQHAEPIAWMVGTAIWWHKDGAERDSEERSEPMVPLGPCDSPSEIARVTAQFKEWQASHHRNYCKAADERDDLRGQLAQARRLLHTASIRLANWLEPGDDPRKQIIAFLEEAAEPTGTEEQPGFELIGPQLLEWNRSLVQPCILIGHEYGVATKAMKLARQALSGKS